MNQADENNAAQEDLYNDGHVAAEHLQWDGRDKDLNFKFCLIFTNLHLNGHTWLVATTVDGVGKPPSVAAPNQPPFLRVALL